MLELVVLAQETIAKRALENATTMLPHATFTFQANSVLQRTSAGVGCQTLPTMADPSLAEVANCANHSWKSSGVDPWMFDYTVTSLQHAFNFAALCTDGQSLDTLAKIAECTRLLLFFAFIAVHRRIAWKICKGHLPSPYLLQA